MRKAVCLVLAGCLGAPVTVAGAGMKGQSQGEKAVRKLTVEQLIDQLGHHSYRVRQAAHRALAVMDTERALPVLLRARKVRTDLEIIHRLDHLIPLLEHTALLKPRLVTLHVDKRPMLDVVAELTRQTGYPIDLDNNNNNNQLFTFHFTRVPFWQALDRVCKEARMAIYPYYYGNNNDRLRLYSYGSPPGPYVKYHETFRMVASGFSYGRNITFTGSYQQDATAPQRSEYLTLNFTIHTEPKLPFLLISTPVITEAYDEHKRSMAPRITGTSVSYYNQSPYSRYGSGSRSFYNSLSASLVRPSRDSKTARLIRGEIPVVLLGKQKEEVVIDKPLAVKKQKFRRGRTEIDLDSVMPANNWGNGKTYQVTMTVKQDTELKQTDYAWSNSLQYRLDLMDAKGTKYLVWSTSLNTRGPRMAQGTISFRPPDNVVIGPPVKLVYYEWMPVPHRIHFEFKDLPLP